MPRIHQSGRRAVASASRDETRLGTVHQETYKQVSTLNVRDKIPFRKAQS
jgi:hypothetical protein